MSFCQPWLCLYVAELLARSHLCPNMPDTTTPTPRIARRSNVLLVLAAISVTFMLFYPHLVRAQNGGGSCPGAQVVDTFTGSGNQTTPEFQTTGESFRISYNSTPTSEDPSLAGFDIFINGEEDAFLNPVSDEGGGSGESFVNEGPGTYSLDINAANVEYEITVEDCTGVTQDQPDDPVVSEPPEDVGASEDQYEAEDGDDGVRTPATGGPPLSIVAAILLWFGVGGILVARRFA